MNREHMIEIGVIPNTPFSLDFTSPLCLEDQRRHAPRICVYIGAAGGGGSGAQQVSVASQEAMRRQQLYNAGGWSLTDILGLW